MVSNHNVSFWKRFNPPLYSLGGLVRFASGTIGVYVTHMETNIVMVYNVTDEQYAIAVPGFVKIFAKL
jgi:hypothetical protein